MYISIMYTLNFINKMNKTFVYIIFTTVITLLFWICWSFNIRKPSSIKLIENIPYDTLIQDTLIAPNLLKCTESQEPLDVLILVTSYVGHVELRNAHRRAMPLRHLNKFNVTRIFLIARIPIHEQYITQEAVKDESSIFGDMLQGSFIENYRNLTYKHLMGLQWAAMHCNTTKYILKVDDDIVFNLEASVNFFKTINNIDRENFIMGYLFNNSVPKRVKQNKWYVSYNEFPLDVYPVYVSGWYYITTPETAARLCMAATYHSHFWIDDVFVTGILTNSLGIKINQLPSNFWLEYYELLECCIRDMISKYIKCTYVVGPNGNRNNLIYEFNNAIQLCQHMKNCTERSVDHSLKNSCVTFRERAIFGDGEPEIRNIKF